MKEEKRILSVLGQVDERYIEEAEPGKRTGKKPAWSRWMPVAACFAVLLVAALPFLQNQNEPHLPGESELPPTQTPQQGIDLTVPKANGLHFVQLAYAAPTTPEVTTDFVIHINPNLYAGGEENGVYMIRPTTPMGEELPECSLEIQRLANVTPSAAAELLGEKLTENYRHVGEIAQAEAIAGFFIHGDNGNEWDDEQVDVTITDDLLGGSYILTARYFTEATEGHGVRFGDMVGTFQAVTSNDAASMPAYLAQLHETISSFAPAFFSDRTDEVRGLLAQEAQVYTYDSDVTDEVVIASVDYRVNGEEIPLSAVVSVKHRLNTEDSYHYLTVELTRDDGGSWRVHFAGIEG